MTILGRGDLSPPRRHGRRRGPVFAAVLVVLLLAVGGWFGWRAWRGSSHPGPTAARVCVTPTPSPTPAPPAQFVLAVLNSTDRQGLAHRVAAELARRGFRIGRVANTTPVVGGSAVVSYGPSLAGAARTVAEQVPGATVAATAPRGIALVLGSGFRALAAPAGVAAARATDLAAASPRPVSCSSP